MDEKESTTNYLQYQFLLKNTNLQKIRYSNNRKSDSKFSVNNISTETCFRAEQRTQEKKTRSQIEQRLHSNMT